ncbi:unnamed protein product, partial [Citrullus colocynthis]
RKDTPVAPSPHLCRSPAFSLSRSRPIADADSLARTSHLTSPPVASGPPLTVPDVAVGLSRQAYSNSRNLGF